MKPRTAGSSLGIGIRLQTSPALISALFSNRPKSDSAASRRWLHGQRRREGHGKPWLPAAVLCAELFGEALGIRQGGRTSASLCETAWLYSNRAVGCEHFPMFTVVRQRVPGAWSFVFVGCPGAPHSEPVEAWRDEHFRRVQCIT